MKIDWADYGFEMHIILDALGLHPDPEDVKTYETLRRVMNRDKVPYYLLTRWNKDESRMFAEVVIALGKSAGVFAEIVRRASHWPKGLSAPQAKRQIEAEIFMLVIKERKDYDRIGALAEEIMGKDKEDGPECPEDEGQFVPGVPLSGPGLTGEENIFTGLVERGKKMERGDLEELRQLSSFIQGGLESTSQFLKQFRNLCLTICPVVYPSGREAITIKASFTAEATAEDAGIRVSPTFRIDCDHNGVFEVFKWLNEQIEKPCCRQIRGDRCLAREHPEQVAAAFRKVFENATHCTCGKPLDKKEGG